MKFEKFLADMIENKQRITIVIENKEHLNEVLTKIGVVNKQLLYFSDKNMKNTKTVFYITEKTSSSCLGKTFDVLVVENFDNISANALMIAVETICAQGFIIFVLNGQTSYFNKCILSRLMEMHKTVLVNEHNVYSVPEFTKTDTIEIDAEKETNAKAREICSFLHSQSPKIKVVSLTALRGRGKSTCLAKCIEKSISQGIGRVLVLSNKPEHFKRIREQLECSLNTKTNKNGCILTTLYCIKFSTEYKVEHSYDLVVVDEAANILQENLLNICKQSKVILSSTTGGYEGTGQLYTHQFLKKLQKKKDVELYETELAHPIRYNSNDYVENWLNGMFCFDKNVIEHDTKQTTVINKEQVVVEKVKTENLINSKEFDQIVLLFMKSHYKNSPNDIQLLFNTPEHTLYVLKYKEQIIGAAQIAEEKQISDISRLQTQVGNLIGWSMYNKLNDSSLLETKGKRIVRICIEETVRSQGLGSFFVEKIEKMSEVDWIGVSFGLDYELLKFWLKNNFMLISINQNKSKSTGNHATLCVKAKGNCIESTKHIQLTMKMFFNNLHTCYSDVSVETICLISAHAMLMNETIEKIMLQEQEIEDLKKFLINTKSFEGINYMIEQILIFCLYNKNNLSCLCKAVTILYVFKRRTFKEICKIYYNLHDADIFEMFKKLVREYLKITGQE